MADMVYKYKTDDVRNLGIDELASPEETLRPPRRRSQRLRAEGIRRWSLL